jgi:YidC/Oxa1 family membrane protein insertase
VRLAGGPTFQLDLGSGAARWPLGSLVYAVSESLDADHAVRALTFTGREASGIQVRQTYRARPDSYAMDLEVEITDVPASLPLTDYSLTVRSWPALTEADRMSDQRALRASSLVGTNLHRERVGGLLKGPKSFDGNVAWAGVQSRYFVAVAALVQGAARGVSASAEERPLPPSAIANLGPRDRAVQQVAINTMIVSLPSAAQPVHRFVLYAGPAELATMGRLPGTQLDRMVDLGISWIRPISALLLRLLNVIEAGLRNYGLAIIVLATVLRLLLHPLNMASMKSMRAMQRLQPRIDALRAKHKTDAQALNAAIMALYAEEKVNPAGGCLPMLIQMPVLIALYQVLFNAIELRQAPFVGWIHDLSAPELLFTLGFIPVRLLPLLMAGSGLLLQRMTPTSPQQAPTAYLMNLFMLYIFYNMPSGLVLYWTVMNVLSALQQWLVLRQDDQPGAAPAAGVARKRAPAGA